MNDPLCGNCGHARSSHYGKCYDPSRCSCIAYRDHTPDDFPAHVPSPKLTELIGHLTYELESLQSVVDCEPGSVVEHYLHALKATLDSIREFNIKGE